MFPLFPLILTMLRLVAALALVLLCMSISRFLLLLPVGDGHYFQKSPNQKHTGPFGSPVLPGRPPHSARQR
jgi:hypothetical protein